MVTISRLYTGRGDLGQTDLANGARVAKTDWRIVALGALSEANATLGLALAAGAGPAEAIEALQQELFDLGADIAMPLPLADAACRAPGPGATSAGAPRISPEQVKAIETQIDGLSASLPPLHSFVLPGGGEVAVRLHLAATVLRRAERAAWAAAERFGTDCAGGLNSLALSYLNRLSDLVFALARVASQGQETLWRSKAERAG
ncbi:MAG: cob(I)yrinic acid a,c-diamide adenosyltransferase [Micrococcales bacterium]|nr:cob(I)yrinic acid a,c-diamide adenosyltransferase [Micrococcales bacterium]